MSELQPGVAQESGGQLRGPANAPEARVERAAQRRQIGRADVRELAGFHIPPDLLDRVQVGRVGRQAFDREPRPLLRDVRLHAVTLVGPQAIPNESDPLAPEMTLEAAQKGDESAVRVGARLSLKE